MRFIEIYRKLEEENEGYMLLVKSGIFFIGVGKTAKILAIQIGLKPICIQPQVCKIAIPTRCMGAYISRIAEFRKAFVLYDYSKKGFQEENFKKYKEIFRFSGEKITEREEHMNCANCWYYNNRMTSNLDDYAKNIDWKGFETNGK